MAAGFHVACDNCGSSDAKIVYGEDDWWCYACNKGKRPGSRSSKSFEVIEEELYMSGNEKIADIQGLPIRGFKEREITKSVTDFFGVRAEISADGTVAKHFYPYGDKAYKCRVVAEKEFYWIGKSDELFGRDKFSSDGRRLIITEGELDAMSIAQAAFAKYSKIYPVVSLPSSSGTKSLLKHRDWVRSFSEVVLCLDQDEAGQKCLAECIKIIGAEKIKIVKLPVKDASDMLVAKGAPALMTAVFEAGRYTPAGIVSKEEVWKALVEYNEAESLPYPPCLEGLNSKLKGMRLGEIALFISGTGSGKSTMLRETMLHIIQTTRESIGIIALEEAPAETARKLAGMQLMRNPAAEEISIADLAVGFEDVYGDDRIFMLDHQGSMADVSIVNQLEYMALMGCKYLFIDHITILVSEGAEDLTGNEAVDKIMNHLLRIAKKHNVWIGLVSHLRKAQSGQKSFEEGRLPSIDDIRGSGSIKQISFDIISFARNLIAEDPVERNTIKMRVLKSRYTGLTGSVRGAQYHYNTGRLEVSDFDPDSDLIEI